mgnify:CR=1 FL=1
MNISVNANNKKIKLYNFNGDKIIVREIIKGEEHFLASFANQKDALDYIDILTGKAIVVKVSEVK